MSATATRLSLVPDQLRAFDDVPRAFWRAVDDQQLAGIVKLGRLTLPERQHIHKLLARPGDPPREQSIVFASEDLRRLGPSADRATYAREIDALLSRLRAGQRG